MASKIVLVTGANNGIGYETVKALLQSTKATYHIFLGCRSLERGSRAFEALKTEVPDTKSSVELLQLDLSDDASIEIAYETVRNRHDHIDTLVNNAGASFDGELLAGRVSLRECFTKAYDVNVAGTHVLTYTFMPLLLKSADPRLVFVAGLSQITQAANSYFPTPPLPAGWPKKVDFETIGYRCSKTALNMLMLDWNHKLKADGVKVWGAGPGFLATGLGGLTEKVREMGGGHPSIGGGFIKDVVEGVRDSDVGKLVQKNGLSAW
ncbi:putative short-chain dehydrogenase [Aspergillus bombycis]|uniref:Putative short-chain dehydrogenase n=1 Tax=Aspergillus bombycis TaxID=109264 RepID=A0A1F8A306_9EURO|nr:putative short-chain dehydrogenase [Aspergillus bombycis]OGM46063.1 putative short-chain dehydrogenase [Aspergillus bombycis]